MKKEIETYYEKHHEIPRQVLSEIDWDANKLAVTASREASYRKTIHGFRNTMTVNHKWNRIDSNLCPLCSKKPETIAHLLQCDQSDMKNMRRSLIAKMIEQWMKLNTQKGLIEHWKTVYEYIEKDDNIPLPKLTMDPTTWKITQAHQHQQKIGWNGFTKGLISDKWTDIQHTHYIKEPKDGENIFRWKSIIVHSLLELIRELWTLRCGFINAESILTERDMISKRTMAMYNENKHLKDMIPIIDRHLFDKNERYFYTSTHETLVIWEERAKKVLKQLGKRDDDQPVITNALTIRQPTYTRDPIDANKQYLDPMEANLQRLGNFIANAKRLRRKRPISNADTSWNKRLKLTHKNQSMRKRKPKRKYVRRKRRRLLNSENDTCTIPVILPQCNFLPNNISSERS